MEELEKWLLSVPEWRLNVTVLCLLGSYITMEIFTGLHDRNPRRRNRSEDIMMGGIRFFVTAISAALCILLLCFDVTPAQYLQNDPTNDTISGDELSARIETISGDLAKSAKELDAIQEKLESRIATVEELKKEAEIAESMLSLSEEQVNAIQAKLNQELEASSGKSLWVNILISAFFFALGLIATPLLDVVKRRLRRTPPQTSVADKDTLTEEELEKFHKLLDELARNELTKAPK